MKKRIRVKSASGPMIRTGSKWRKVNSPDLYFEVIAGDDAPSAKYFLFDIEHRPYLVRNIKTNEELTIQRNDLLSSAYKWVK